MTSNNFNNATLFKYVAGKSFHLESIAENYFYFSRVGEVNDPEDCKVNPKLDLSDTTEQEIHDFYNRMCHTIADEIIKTDKINRNRIAKERLPDLNRKEDFTEKTYREIYDVIKEYKDVQKNVQYVIDNPKEYARKVEEENKVEDEKIRQTVKLLCLTDNPFSSHMWQKYAKKVNPMDGICLGYNCKPLEERKIVEYHKQYKIHLKPNQLTIPNGERPDSLNAVQIHYGDDALIPYNSFKHNVRDLRFVYYHKRSEWKEESEYRCVLPDEATFNNKDIQEIKYPPNILTAIIFGQNCDYDTKKEVKKCVNQNGEYNLKYHISRKNEAGDIEIDPE